MRDIIVPVQGQDKFHYYQGITYQFHRDIAERDDAIAVYFAWGDGRTGTATYVINAMYRFSDTSNLINLLLHPVIQVGSVARDVVEDLEMAWKSQPHVVAVAKTIDAALNSDSTLFATRPRVPVSQPEFNQTDYGEYDYYEAPTLLADSDERVLQTIWKVVYTNGRAFEMKNLHDAMEQWIPVLFDHEKGENLEIGQPASMNQ